MKRIGVIFGGKSGEHTVSLMSAASVLTALDKEKYEIVTIGITRDGEWLLYDGPVSAIEDGSWEGKARADLAGDPAGYEIVVFGTGSRSLKERIDFALPILHGPYGEDGTIQGLFEIMGIPYGGCGVTGSAVCMDKGMAKSVFEQGNLPQVKHLMIRREELLGTVSTDGKIDSQANGKTDGEVTGKESGEPDNKACGEAGHRTDDEMADKMDSGTDSQANRGTDRKENDEVDGQAKGGTGSEVNRGMMQKLEEEVAEKLGYPVFVKPANMGSSVGIAKVQSAEDLGPAIEKAAKYDRRIVVEQFVNGREIETAILGNHRLEAAAIGEILPSNEFYDFEAKYFDGGKSKLCLPADLTEEQKQQIHTIARKAYEMTDCCGYARVDFFVERNTGEIFINEINTIPGFTRFSMFPLLWQECGLSYSALIDRIIELGYERYESKNAVL